MFALLTALAKFAEWLGQYFANQQLLDAGKAEQKVTAQTEVEAHVQQAKDAVATPDVARTERLRTRFDEADDGS